MELRLQSANVNDFAQELPVLRGNRGEYLYGPSDSRAGLPSMHLNLEDGT
jgi:hypothetical protein